MEKYILGRDQCQWYKAAAHPQATLQPHKIPEVPWMVIGVDLITGLPPPKGKNAIATYVDLYSKQVHLAATTDNVRTRATKGGRRSWREFWGSPRGCSTRGEDFSEAIGNALSDLAVVLYLWTDGQQSSDGERSRREGWETRREKGD